MNEYIDFINQTFVNQGLFSAKAIDDALGDISKTLFNRAIQTIRSHDFERAALLYSLSTVFSKLSSLATKNFFEAWRIWADSQEVPF